MGILSVQQIRESLERSGYLMEQRIAPLFERRGYYVVRNQEYEDPDTGKSREIDIHALRLVSLYRADYDDLLNSTIIASCKNNHLPIVLFSHHNPLRGMDRAMDIPKAGFPLTVRLGDDDEESIETFLQKSSRRENRRVQSRGLYSGDQVTGYQRRILYRLCARVISQNVSFKVRSGVSVH